MKKKHSDNSNKFKQNWNEMNGIIIYKNGLIYSNAHIFMFVNDTFFVCQNYVHIKLNYVLNALYFECLLRKTIY